MNLCEFFAIFNSKFLHMKLPFALASRFVAAETFKETIPKIKAINQKEIRVTLDLLGENVKERKTADETVETYIELLESIHGAGLSSTISVKLTMMGLDIETEYCKENLFRLLDKAKELKSFVRIDMEGSDYTQVTLDIFREAHEKYSGFVGIVIQAYLHRSAQDIRDLADMGADVRLCKGAYKEPASIALQKMPDIRNAFKEYAKVLLEKTIFPRMATHDDELIDWLKSYTLEQKIDKDRFEFQMLYGLREETMEEFVREGYKARVYVPYGTMWFPYFKRRLMERKENVLFVLSNLFKK